MQPCSSARWASAWAWCSVIPIGFSMYRFCPWVRHQVQRSYMICGWPMTYTASGATASTISR